MMRRSIRLAAIVFAMAPSPSAQAQAASPVCTDYPADAKAVADTVHAFYDAERTGDSAHWRALTTPDFYMFHEGENTPPGDFVKFINNAHEMQQKYDAVWTMDIIDLKISVGCTTALTTQTLHNVEDAPAAKTHPAYDETFLESLWLRKTPDGGWKIAFWNVSKVAKAAPSAGESK